MLVFISTRSMIKQSQRAYLTLGCKVARHKYCKHGLYVGPIVHKYLRYVTVRWPQ